MKKNVGRVDKTFRLVIAVALFIIGLVSNVGVGIKAVIFIAAATALFTALSGT